ncbi:MAG: flavodoxin family protein [Lachnospiraceae bacterium]|nr:flavodoxin family protein [Lachnospiraceae bacterium]
MSEKRKKVVAFTAGRRGGNTEIYVKIALEAIAKMGIDCELIRLHECDLRPCKDCLRGPCYVKGPEACILKDDGPWLAEKFLDSDGYILGAPVWSLSPCGVVTDFRDRVFGPKMDLAMWEQGGIPDWAKGRVKQRPGGLISVGGALTENWTSLGLATLYTTTFSAQTNVVDNLNVYQVADPGEALMREDYMIRAKFLGENVGHAVLNPQKDWENKWLGEMDDGEACPGCHQSLMIAKPGRDYVECAICGRIGKVSFDKDGKLTYVWPEDNKNRLTMMGKFAHAREIELHTQQRFLPHEAEIQDELKRYRTMEDFTVNAPSKTAKASKAKAQKA